ncbi:heparinase II/III-family protein [bacterium]|nr:heparinase II/III-family protein [bacterium]
MRKKISLLLTLELLCAAQAFAAGSTTLANLIVSDHPRLMFATKSWPAGPDIETVAARVGQAPWDKWYARLSRQEFHTAALDCLIRSANGEEAGPQADSVIARMLALPPQDDLFYNGENLQRMSLAYDWLYNYEGFTPEKKEALRAKMFAMAAKLTDRDSLTGQVFFGPEIMHNYYSNGALALGLTGLALYEGFSDTSATRLIRLAMDWYSRSFEAMAMMEGGWHEGMAYSLNHFIQETPIWFAALQSATGADLFARIKRNQGDWMELWIYFCLASLRPDWTYVRSGDMPAPRMLPDYTLRQALEIIVAAYRNGHGRFLIDEAEARLGERAMNSGDLWMPLLFYDPSIRPVDYRELNPSQAINLKRLGYVTLRSGWGPDDTFIHFECGDFFGSHDHLDQNQFTIYRRGALALDAGYYDGYSPHHVKYATRAIAHNTVLVKDPREKVPSRRFESWSSEGGQRALDYWFRNSNRNIGDYWAQYRSGANADMGDIVAWQSCGAFDYVAGDATRAYNSTLVTDPDSRPKISRFVRRLLFVKPSTVAVCDNVDSTDPEFGKTWLLHTVNEPQFGADGTITACEGQGQLTLYPLFPEDVNRSKVGGSGHEFEVNGENLPLSGGNYFGPPAQPGAWTVELSPGGARLQDLFVNVIELSDSGVAPGHTFRRVGSPDLAGAVADTLALLFTRDRDPDSGPTRSLVLPEGLPAGCRVYLAGVDKRTVFRLLSGGQPVTALYSGEAGVLTFRLEASGPASLKRVP